ncbi:hypothetical protein [Haliangium sp.]|uniref:hypothetical protein n=1 Tax=Haliangium sp. TaxID=2663208 RepID=UPI003D148FFD
MSATKTLLDYHRQAVVLHEATDTYADLIGAKLAEVFTPDGDGEPTIDWAHVLRTVGRTVLTKANQAIEAEKAHREEQADDIEPRERRDIHVASLYQRLTALRAVTRSVYGDSINGLFGFDGTTPTEPMALYHLGQQVLDRLSRLDNLDPLVTGFAFDSEVQRAALQEDVDALGKAIHDVARESRELGLTQVAKNESFEAFRSLMGFSARALEALLGAVGEDDLAGRIRLRTRRPGNGEPELPTPPETPTDAPEIAPEA